MSEFMEEVVDDLDAVFLDLDTFGSEHLVNGKAIPILFDSEELERVTKEGKFRDDVHKGDVLFFAKEKDLGSELHPGEMLSMDGRDRFIQSADLVEGLWRIVIGRKQL